MKKLALFVVLITVATSSFARESFTEQLAKKPPPPSPGPWFTGPILTPSAQVVPTGHQNYEPYVYWTQVKGAYNANWNVMSQPLFTAVLFQGTIQLGIFPKTELDIAPQVLDNSKQNQKMWRVSDMPVSLAFQILDNTVHKAYPFVKLRFGTNLPLGKYDNLNPARLTTDAGGIGTWYPGVGFVVGRTFQYDDVHYLASRIFLTYNFGTPVKVKGLSVYGGAPTTPGVKGTNGTEYPGNIILFLAGFEFSVTQNWALALDIEYQHTDASRFSGYSPPGTTPLVPSQEVFAFAPGIEYNWNENIGVIVGPWFSAAGRNTQKFISYVGALNIYV